MEAKKQIKNFADLYTTHRHLTLW